MEVGELIGYRAWLWKAPYLHSITQSEYKWDYDQPAGGDSLSSSGGIYSFADMKTLKAELKLDCGIGYVYGSIYIWGEVITHETGYRAQYARIRSLDGIWAVPWSWHKIAQIRKFYKLEE